MNIDKVAEVIREYLSLEDFKGEQLYEGTIDPDELAQAIVAAMELTEFTCDGERWWSTPVDGGTAMRLNWKTYGDTGRTALGSHGGWRVFTDGKWWHLTHQVFGDPLTVPRGKFVDRQRAMEFAQEREDGVEIVPAPEEQP